MSARNPFASGVYDGIQTYKISSYDRIRAVKSFDRSQCLAALKVPYLQKTVVQAVNSRLRQLDKEKA